MVSSYNFFELLLQEASEAAKICASLTGNLSCVWKLHGDVQVLDFSSLTHRLSLLGISYSE